MTEQECIEKLNMLNDALNENFVEVDECSYALQMGIEALEKQIPKKPKGVDRDICPNCGTFNSIIQKRRNAVGSDTIYCWHCGTAIECEV